MTRPRPQWQAWHGWGLLVAAVALGVAAGALAAMWVSGPAASAVGAGLAVAVFGAVGARGKALLEKQAQQREALPQHIVGVGLSGRPRRVRELDDPIALGTHPAEAVGRVLGDRAVVDRVPPYVPRDIQPRLRGLVGAGGFVLLVGDSTAGKTRAAYEAVRALLPDHTLIAPAGRDSLAAIVPAAEAERRCVVWLDDLERFLGADGLTATTIGRLLDAEGRRDALVLATMRTAEYDRYSVREQGSRDAGREMWRAGREVLELAHVLEVRRDWTGAELERARGFTDDARIRAALKQCPRFGLAEALAAGPELVQDWHNAWRAGAHPRGAALVAAAVDCWRAGIHEPVPIGLLAELAEIYLAQRQGPLLRPEPLTEALGWATSVSHGTSSLLLPTPHPDCYLAFDYLIHLPGHDAVPRATLNTLVEYATPAQAFDVGMIALERSDVPLMVTTFTKAATGAIADADIWLAKATAFAGDHAGARRMLNRIIANRTSSVGPDNRGVLRARYELAYVSSHIEDAPTVSVRWESLIEDQTRILGPDDPNTLASRFQHAQSVGMSDPTRAVALYEDLIFDQQRLLGPFDLSTLYSRHSMAIDLAVAGDTGRALILATNILLDEEVNLGPDHVITLKARDIVARLTGEVGDPTQAVEQFQQLLTDRIRILGPNHPFTLGTHIDLIYWMTRAGDRGATAAALTQILTQWQRELGPENPAKLLARNGKLGTGSLPPPDTPRARQSLTNFLWTCQQLLGPDHPQTIATKQLLSQLRAPKS